MLVEGGAALVISGARQVGKSTLMQQLIAGRDAREITLDTAVDRVAAERDPDGFALQFPQGVLAIDEIQRVPALLTSLKAAVDRNREAEGRRSRGVARSGGAYDSGGRFDTRTWTP